MLARIDLRGRGGADLDGALPRARLDVAAAVDWVVDSLRADAGRVVVDSDAISALFGALADLAAVRRSLLDHGVLARDVGLAGWPRVTVSTDDDMTASRNALTAVLEETR